MAQMLKYLSAYAGEMDWTKSFGEALVQGYIQFSDIAKLKKSLH
jgi:hypothetical protein